MYSAFNEKLATYRWFTTILLYVVAGHVALLVAAALWFFSEAGPFLSVGVGVLLLVLSAHFIGWPRRSAFEQVHPANEVEMKEPRS